MDNLFEDHDELALRIYDYLGGKSSEAEAKELLLHLSRHEQSRVLYQKLTVSWALASVPSFLEKEDENLEKIKQHIIDNERMTGIRMNWFNIVKTITAFFLLFVLLNVWWYRNTQTLRIDNKRIERSCQMKVEEGVDISLLGTIYLTGPEGRELVLHPQEQASNKRKTGCLVKRKADVGRCIDRMKDKLSFEKASLEDIVRQLERGFNAWNVSDILKELDIENNTIGK